MEACENPSFHWDGATVRAGGTLPRESPVAHPSSSAPHAIRSDLAFQSAVAELSQTFEGVVCGWIEAAAVRPTV